MKQELKAKLFITKDKQINIKDTEKVTEMSVLEATNEHIIGVKNAFYWLTERGREQVDNHDHTKLEYLAMFTRYLQKLGQGKGKEPDDIRGINFFKDIHAVKERHHLNDHVPEDVNLLDVLEWIVDCSVAGLQRSGDIHPLTIPNDVLQSAVKNTVELIKRNNTIMGVDTGESDY